MAILVHRLGWHRRGTAGLAVALMLLATFSALPRSASAARAETSPLVLTSSTSLLRDQDTQSYTMTVTNIGDSAAGPLAVSASTPPGANILRATTDAGQFKNGSWSITELGAGMFATLMLDTAR